MLLQAERLERAPAVPYRAAADRVRPGHHDAHVPLRQVPLHPPQQLLYDRGAGGRRRGGGGAERLQAHRLERLRQAPLHPLQRLLRAAQARPQGRTRALLV
jgi:hypothetical protein